MIPTVSVVSGGARGLGAALVKALAADALTGKKGGTVWLGARDMAAARRLADTLGPHVRPLRVDVTDMNSVEEARSNVLKESGRVDLLINNAGIYPDQDQHPEEISPKTLVDTFAVNVGGAHSMIQAFLPLLRQGVSPAIVNISSGLGSLENTSRWDFTALSYGTSKAALNMLSLQWSHVLAPAGIAIVMVSPGWLQTEMGRPDGKPPDVGADIVLRAARAARLGKLNKVFCDQNGRVPW